MWSANLCCVTNWLCDLLVVIVAFSFSYLLHCFTGYISKSCLRMSEFYLRYYVGHKGKFGHEFLEFEFRPDGTLLCRIC